MYSLDERGREEMGIRPLPETIWEACDALERDPVVREGLGEHIFRRFVEAKRIEWNIYRTQVHGWELDRYLDTT